MRLNETRHRFSRSVTGIALSLVLLAGTTTVVNVASSHDAAGTLGTIHRLAISPLSEGRAIEGAARVTFSCNDITGYYKLAFTGVQPIHWDRVTRWGSLIVFGTVENLAGDHDSVLDRFTLVQNDRNGLFDGSVRGYLAAAADCGTGARFTGGDDDTFFREMLFRADLT